ncbi:hypothetical protein F4677DRAFT_282788 [Hypoxylon crocopeplum]|nr:hypothetical protein F4677DRAFT_282788 [Hypoxylon crocopeplum]
MDRESTLFIASTRKSPPPPYSQFADEEAGQTSAVSSRKPQANTQSLRERVPIASPFPSSWNLYHTLSIGRILMLGPHNRQPLLAVSRHTGWWTGKPDLVLHSGPSDTLPPLAAGMGGVGVGRHSIIVLPPMPGSALDSSQELLVRVEEETDWPPHVRFKFSIDLSVEPGQWRRETFEWRHSHGDVVSIFLNGARTGWKLLRLAGQGNGNFAEARSSDGCEIVAVWAYARLSFTKVLKFRFLGSGATGILGERWAIMAVMTALRMYQRQQRNRNGDW